MSKVELRGFLTPAEIEARRIVSDSNGVDAHPYEAKDYVLL
jgi:hypothetical protein